MGNDNSCECVSVDKLCQSENLSANRNSPIPLTTLNQRKQASAAVRARRNPVINSPAHRKSRIFGVEERILDSQLFRETFSSSVSQQFQDVYMPIQSLNYEEQQQQCSSPRLAPKRMIPNRRKHKTAGQCELSIEGYSQLHQELQRQDNSSGENNNNLLEIEFVPWDFQQEELELQDKPVQTRQQFTYPGKITEQTIEDEDEEDNYSRQFKMKREILYQEQPQSQLEASIMSQESSLCNIQSLDAQHFESVKNARRESTNAFDDTTYSYNSPCRPSVVRNSGNIIFETIRKYSSAQEQLTQLPIEL